MSGSVFINLSHHPPSSWAPEQRTAADAYGRVVNIAFPNIPPEATAEQVLNMAKGILNDLFAIAGDGTAHVLAMGEQSLTAELHRLHERLPESQRRKLRFLIATFRRASWEEDGRRVIRQAFVQFREVLTAEELME